GGGGRRPPAGRGGTDEPLVLAQGRDGPPEPLVPCPLRATSGPGCLQAPVLRQAPRRPRPPRPRPLGLRRAGSVHSGAGPGQPRGRRAPRPPGRPDWPPATTTPPARPAARPPPPPQITDSTQ